MQPRIRHAVPLLALSTALAAQCQQGSGSFTITPGLAAVVSQSDNPVFVVQTTDPNKVYGGSLRAMRTSELSRPNAIGLIGLGRIPLILNEATTDNYWGMNVRGNFVPLTLNAPGKQFAYGQEVMLIEDNGRVHVFGHWHDQWTTAAVTSSNVGAIPGRALIVAQDGPNRLLGFSWLSPDNQPVVLQLGNTKTASHIPGVGEPDTRRNAQAFETDPNEVTVFCAHTNAWHKVSTTSPARTLTLDYDKNVVSMLDVAANQIICFSDLSGTHSVVTLADATKVTTETQDFGIYVIDGVNGNAYLMRAIDGGIALLPGVGSRIQPGGAFTNNLWALAIKDPVTPAIDWYACSTSKRGAQFVAAGASGETKVHEAGNDNTFVLVTDQALYGFSAFTNRWTRLANPQGTFVKADGEDFIGFVETSTHVYVYSPREDKWTARPKSASFVRVFDTDTTIVIDDATSKTAYGTNGATFRTHMVAGTKIAEGQSNSYHYSIHDDPSGPGSLVHLYQAFSDRWITLTTQNRLVLANITITRDEDAVYIADGNRLHVLTGFGDLTSQWGAPNDNYAWHATPGKLARFFAYGRPNAALALLVGIDRAEIQLPGICNPLQLDPNNILAIPLPNLDVHGNLRFDAPLPNAPYLWRLQTISLANNTLELGRLLNFEVY